ncbi:hypothetical protein FXO38_35508, partial [Capsicum annuum]
MFIKVFENYCKILHIKKLTPGSFTNILRKYSGPVDIWLSLLSAKFHLSGLVHCLLNEHPRRSLAAMAQHT